MAEAPIGTAQACAIAARLQTVIEIEKPFFVPIRSIILPTRSRPMA